MTDLEMVKKCAETMGLDVRMFNGVFLFPHPRSVDGSTTIIYDPLTNDAQAMALVKKCGLIIEPDGAFPTREWWVQVWISDEIRWDGVANKDLNRAIVECVARMK